MGQQPDTILVCPLNWGLGHATRDIPIIRSYLQQGYRVVVASEANIIQLLQQEVPGIETDYFQGAHITYSSGNNQIWKLMQQLPLALFWLIREKQITAKLVKKYKPACIISDNRYGVRHSKVKSVIITHQLMLKMPSGLSWLEKPFHCLIKLLVSGFSECWIPDSPLPDLLAGDLAHRYKLPQNARFIGPLSRFADSYDEPLELTTTEKYAPDLLVILSGPEPQRTILQKIISEKAMSENIKTLIIAGKPEIKAISSDNSCNLQILPHLKSGQLKYLITKTPYVICRSGYTTLMDLWYLKKSAIVIPTPGQTEQEYLAGYHHQKNHFAISQTDFKAISLKQLFKISEASFRTYF